MTVCPFVNKITQTLLVGSWNLVQLRSHSILRVIWITAWIQENNPDFPIYLLLRALAEVCTPQVLLMKLKQ